jgi:hypothetical protein
MSLRSQINKHRNVSRFVQICARIRRELVGTTLAAEVVSLSVVLADMLGADGIDGHPADRITGKRRRRRTGSHRLLF